MLDVEKWTAAKLAHKLNPTIQLRPGNKAVKQLSDGSLLQISNSTIGVKLYWGLQHCKAGLQHFRFCTPHALSKPLSLNCFFCNYDEAECVAAGRQKPAVSELWLMHELMGAGLSTDWCWQVALPWWPAAADFLHLSQKAVMQVDGAGHFKDLFDTTCRTTLETDMRFCVAAVAAGTSVIRIHELQQRMWLRPTFLPNATTYATSCLCIVLTPSYNSVCLYDGGRMITYVAKLASMLTDCGVVHFDWGTLLICKK